jgi:hypothetical protein
MADDSDVLLKFFEEDWRQVRQEENQRTAFSNIVFLIASAVLGLLTQFGLSREVLPLTLVLIVLGIFGGIASEKLYERSKLHMELAWAWRRRLYELHPEAQVDRMVAEAVDINRKRFPRLMRIHLHHVWLILDLFIALSGMALTGFVILNT